MVFETELKLAKPSAEVNKVDEDLKYLSEKLGQLQESSTPLPVKLIFDNND